MRSVNVFGIRIDSAKRQVVEWYVNCEFNHSFVERELIKVDD